FTIPIELASFALVNSGSVQQAFIRNASRVALFPLSSAGIADKTLYVMCFRFLHSMTPGLNRFLLATIVLFSVTSAASAQAARKFDEFIGETDYEDLIARLDSFAVALKNEPSAQGQIIVYRTRHDSPLVGKRALRRAKDYLLRVNHIDPTRIQTIDGGMTGCLWYELWVVPPGASPPARRFTYQYPLRRLEPAPKQRRT
ncbi:MAG TPA: hypothetical protein VE961_24250, partial [Pyrinomonadaceae bacterium]|nr:hypothetical protein [Pyrinomonadaceae bacterium]